MKVALNNTAVLENLGWMPRVSMLQMMMDHPSTSQQHTLCEVLLMVKFILCKKYGLSHSAKNHQKNREAALGAIVLEFSVVSVKYL